MANFLRPGTAESDESSGDENTFRNDPRDAADTPPSAERPGAPSRLCLKGLEDEEAGDRSSGESDTRWLWRSSLGVLGDRGECASLCERRCIRREADARGPLAVALRSVVGGEGATAEWPYSMEKSLAPTPLGSLVFKCLSRDLSMMVRGWRR